ncbi:hypothetical protein OPU71_17020 [Niveibacterium sp. 24ML]|uniref:hypothetical protein n=1 Tax=Niveibacterium sp. 24ML TaxID=2985512 RepID=UPI00226FE143|nr:hypothetical protein [Niveibacterium sp. 24ML]MCX9157828.1 hypothetical protein [Niveibacterium sp. 24ML]
MSDDEQLPPWLPIAIGVRLIRVASALGALHWIQAITKHTTIGRTINVLHSLSEFDDLDELL